MTGVQTCALPISVFRQNPARKKPSAAPKKQDIRDSENEVISEENSLRSKVSPGPVRPLKIGDSEADILGKMYNFMLKTDEKKILNNEIEAAFKQEQLDEDERRHQELVKAIRKYTGKKGKGVNKEDSDFSLFDLLKFLPLLLALPKIPGLPKIPNIKPAPEIGRAHV